jgi:hypothetical protein
MYYVELSSCNPVSSDRGFLLRFWFQSAFRILETLEGVLVAVVARGACLTFREISTCPLDSP